MEQTITNSKSVSKLEYSEDTKTLIITYTTGKRYEYEGVPESVVTDMTKAESVGQYINQHIKGKYNYKLIN